MLNKKLRQYIDRYESLKKPLVTYGYLRVGS